MTTTMTTTLATSNLRSSSRQTRTTSARTSKFLGTTLGQNSLISNPPPPQPTVSEPHGFYPAIQHFADAVTALPRDYRRHTSLLKEVDAKAWAPEEHLQALLTQCLSEPPLPSTVVNAENIRNINTDIHEGNTLSGSDRATGAALDVASQQSSQSVDPDLRKRRELYTSLRHTLIQMMVTMDEKNHVINNANEDLSRHIRRLDNIYPRIADEVSEEARLGSLKHWAYFETNVTRKAQSSRREAAASLAIMHDTEIAQRSENRREAVLAKRHRLNQVAVDSDFDDTRPTGRKGNANSKTRRIAEAVIDSVGLNNSGANAGKKKRNEKSIAGAIGMERSLSGVLGGRAMSREPSQQDGNSKKRKAPASATTGARKRLNASTHDSPRLVSSPLAGAFGKEGHKRSPIPSAARPLTSRARQNSNQPPDASRARPSSSASHKPNGHNVTASASELHDVAAITGKTATEVKSTMKETTNGRGDRLIEEKNGPVEDGESGLRGGIVFERSTSRSGALKREANASDEGSSARSPRLPAPLQTSSDRLVRGRTSKTSTPVVGTFAESDASESVGGTSANAATNGNNGNGKSKRLARPRMKDHHALNDSLSPKSLPAKRSHKKGASQTFQLPQSSQTQAQRLASEDNATNSVTPEYQGSGSTDADAVGAADIEDDENENGDEEQDEDDERYCYCNGVSYGEMVACDNKSCKREWFHLECAGLKKAPGDKAKWYCEECKEILARKGRFGSGSVSNGSGGASAGSGNGHGSGNAGGNGK